MIDFAMKGLRALAVIGIVVVIGQHVDMAWWEGGVLSFGIMLLSDRN